MGPLTTVGAVTARLQAAATIRSSSGIVRIGLLGGRSLQSCVRPSDKQERGEPEGRPVQIVFESDAYPR
jgi:hypothetical protein